MDDIREEMIQIGKNIEKDVLWEWVQYVSGERKTPPGIRLYPSTTRVALVPITYHLMFDTPGE